MKSIYFAAYGLIISVLQNSHCNLGQEGGLRRSDEMELGRTTKQRPPYSGSRCSLKYHMEKLFLRIYRPPDEGGDGTSDERSNDEDPYLG